MSPTHMTDRLTRLFQESLNVELPGVETDLFESGVLDSLRFVELLTSLEREFNTRISMEDIDIEHFRCIGKIVEFLLARTVQGAPAAN